MSYFGAVGLGSVYIANLLTDKLPPAVAVVAKALPIWWMAAQTRGAHTSDKNTKYAWRVFIGLLFCSVGDLCLDLEHHSELFFLGGLASFLVGHVWYIAAFAVGHPTVVCPMHGIPFYVFALGMFKYLQDSLPEDLTIPVLVYSLVIATMGHRAVTRRTHVFASTGVSLAMWGSLSFILSDSILAINKFAHPFKNAKVAVMVTYYLGQILIGQSATPAALAGALAPPPPPTPSKKD